jgi:hypothetical protein
LHQLYKNYNIGAWETKISFLKLQIASKAFLELNKLKNVAIFVDST